MADLILDSLEIRNFRAFRHLRIEKLGRVNLITGKNNVGKSSLLEALAVFSSHGNPTLIWELLGRRDEVRASFGTRLTPSETDLPEVVRHLLFNRPRYDFNLAPINIGPTDNGAKTLSLTFIWATSQQDESGVVRLKPITNQSDFGFLNLIPALLLQRGTTNSFYRLDELHNNTLISKHLVLPEIICVFIHENGLEKAHINAFWDAIALSEEEKDVLNALQLIAPAVRGINLIGNKDGLGERYAIVKIDNATNPIPLRSMGEGMNRLFGIALALVNAKDGFLLIDEVETGIHYSALSDVWRLIFQVAQRLNVQVFATTHSWDCIQAFQQAASANPDVEGELIRLTNKNGNVVTDVFNERDLEIVTENAIEVR